MPSLMLEGPWRGTSVTKFEDVDWSKLPQPPDDGTAAHLFGSKMPSIALPSTGGGKVDLAQLRGLTVVYAYPMTGRPGVALPDEWDAIPGARGCTPQACAFRDHAAGLKASGVERLFGLSTQSIEEQQEARSRLHLNFALLSDECLSLANALRLPTFGVQGRTLLRRLTLIVRDGRVEHVFYPVFPPDGAAEEVAAWLRERGANRE